MMTLLHAKTLLAIGVGACLPLALAGLPINSRPDAAPAAVASETVRLAPESFRYRVAGEFTREGRPVNAPMLERRSKKPLSIMKAQVTEAEFDRCVRDGGCRPIGQRGKARADVPVVGVSWEDASAYARWLSARTGQVWRLPTDEEWVFAAGSRAKDDALDVDSTDISQRWLAKYEEESSRQRLSDRGPRPVGGFGANEHGLLDLSGNVWEWTDSCFTRQTLDADDRVIGEGTVNCGVRVIQGAHRGYTTTFIRDARGGGCSMGVPPDYLGFRLVREEGSWLANVTSRLRRPFERIS